VKRLNNRLKEARLAKQLTQKELASMVGISESYYCQLETGARRISLPIAQKISVALDKGLDDLFSPSSKAKCNGKVIDKEN
jgi:putative transcriptional regulator